MDCDHGTSGSGKTTLLNLIGSSSATRGAVRIDGTIPQGFAIRAGALSQRDGRFVFQQFHLCASDGDRKRDAAQFFHSMTTSRGTRGAETRGMQDRASHLPRSFRAASSSASRSPALVNDPKIILADEPTGNLDARISASCLRS